jgi:peptide/nickel transport system permease protein
MAAPLAKFLLTRLLRVAGVVLMATIVTWLFIHLLRPEVWEFDERHLLVQLGDYLQRAFLHFDFGTSWSRGQPEVADLVRRGLPADLWLLAGGLAFGIGAGMTAGAIVAAAPASAPARVIGSVSMFFLCAPVYLVGFCLLLLFGRNIAALGFGFIPLQYVDFDVSPARWLTSLITPWIVLGLPLAGACERMMTSSMRDVLGKEFVGTALAKGLSRGRMVRRHAVPAAAAPVLTLAGANVPIMVSNLVLVELTFSVPGVFQDVQNSVANGDFPVIQATVIAGALLVAIASVVVDGALTWLDPRTRGG